MDGIIVINKPKGCTSHDVVHKIKKLFGKKVGHTGTLDPNATGVLPILIGKGTELSQFLINHDKKYIATIQLGIKTDTGDVEGNVIEEKNVDLDNYDKNQINEILKKMLGKQKQIPPIYSAIKVNGKKLYEYARSGKTVDIPEREIEIYDLKCLNFDVVNKLLVFEIYCSKGTYVRTVCEKIAELLNTVGYMKELERTMVGDFNIEKSITIEELKDNFQNQNFLDENIISIEKFFGNKPMIILDEKKLKLFLNGVKLDFSYNKSLNCNSEFVRIYNENNKFIGIGIYENGKLRRKIVLD